jgi:ribokinase
MYDIVTIGSATRDNFLKLDYQLVKWSKTSSGRAIALPLGEKLEVKKVFLTIGGNAANASVTFSRQGFKTGCFGKVGNDLSGQELISRLKKEGIDPFFSVSFKKPTAYSVLLLSDKGERTILGYHGAADDLGLEDIPWSKLKSNWWYLSLSGESDKLLEPLLKFAKKNNIKVAFNPSGHHIKHYRNRILSVLKYLSFLVVNETEAANLTGISFKKEKEVFRRLDKLTPGIVAVTSGPKGVMVSDGKQVYKAGIIREQKQVDRTGAGDAFGSGFVAGLMQKIGNWKLKIENLSPEAIKYAIRLATANAASVVEHIGATEGILTKKDFETNPRWKNLKISMRKFN